MQTNDKRIEINWRLWSSIKGKLTWIWSCSSEMRNRDEEKMKRRKQEEEPGETLEICLYFRSVKSEECTTLESWKGATFSVGWFMVELSSLYRTRKVFG